MSASGRKLGCPRRQWEYTKPHTTPHNLKTDSGAYNTPTATEVGRFKVLLVEEIGDNSMNLIHEGLMVQKRTEGTINKN